MLESKFFRLREKDRVAQLSATQPISGQHENEQKIGQHGLCCVDDSRVPLRRFRTIVGVVEGVLDELEIVRALVAERRAAESLISARY